jgi:hypothetical protein
MAEWDQTPRPPDFRYPRVSARRDRLLLFLSYKNVGLLRSWRAGQPKGAAVISSILADAVNKIRDYLNDPAHSGAYIGATRREIEALLDEMDRVRKKLDTLPP